MIRLYARSPRSQRAIGNRPQKRGQNVSIVDALALRGSIAVTTVLGAMNGLTFEAYLIRRVVPHLWTGACLVLDNSSTQNVRMYASQAVGLKSGSGSFAAWVCCSF
jgi:hypothetical protein